MERTDIHDLAAAYALNALDPEDRWTYERHLDTCEPCRDEVAALREGATELAYAAEGPEPSPDLRERILRAAREERPAPVTPTRRRWLFPTTAIAAVAATVAAVGLGLWGNSLRSDVDEARSAAADAELVENILAHGDARRFELEGAAGNVLVSVDGEAVLAVCDLRRPPAGKTYQAWVIEGGPPQPAGVFAPDDDDCVTFLLRLPVDAGGMVAVTLENEGGAQAPTGEILMSANV